MAQTRKTGRRIIQVLIALVVVADLGLAVVNWRISQTPAETRLDQIRSLRHERDLLALDKQNAENIRRDLPGVQKQCADFFQQQLRPSEGGYSAISSDLGTLARDAGLQISATRFRQKPVEKHGVEEVSVSLNMEGQYPGLVGFINALEHSHNFYMLDSLTLDSSAGGVLRLSVELRTYFRS
jgi:Tfp pilus assembly protein PilO